MTRGVFLWSCLVAACSKQADEPAGWKPLAGAPAAEVAPSARGASGLPAPAWRPKLSAREGALEIIEAGTATVGVAAVTRVRVTPAPGFHINTEYPFTLSLTTARGVSLAKSELRGGRGSAGDAEQLDENGMTIAVAATATTSGDHAITGTIHFGICQRDRCLSRDAPVSFALSARCAGDQPC